MLLCPCSDQTAPKLSCHRQVRVPVTSWHLMRTAPLLCFHGHLHVSLTPGHYRTHAVHDHEATIQKGLLSSAASENHSSSVGQGQGSDYRGASSHGWGFGTTGTWGWELRFTEQTHAYETSEFIQSPDMVTNLPRTTQSENDLEGKTLRRSGHHPAGPSHDMSEAFSGFLGFTVIRCFPQSLPFVTGWRTQFLRTKSANQASGFVSSILLSITYSVSTAALWSAISIGSNLLSYQKKFGWHCHSCMK